MIFKLLYDTQIVRCTVFGRKFVQRILVSCLFVPVNILAAAKALNTGQTNFLYDGMESLDLS